MKLIIELPDNLKEPKDYFEYFGVWSTKLSEVLEKAEIADDVRSQTHSEDVPIKDIKLFNGCSSCKSKDKCEDAFHSNAVHCNAYGKKEI